MPNQSPNEISERAANEMPHQHCDACNGTGVVELVMTDLSREPWPCPYCEAGTLFRQSPDAGKNQSAESSGTDS